MQKKWLWPVILLALILCLALARYADQWHGRPGQSDEPTHSESASPEPSEEIEKPADIENGLGWG